MCRKSNFTFVPMIKIYSLSSSFQTDHFLNYDQNKCYHKISFKWFQRTVYSRLRKLIGQDPVTFDQLILSVRSSLFYLFNQCIRVLWLLAWNATSESKVPFVRTFSMPFLIVLHGPLDLSAVGKWLSEGKRTGRFPHPPRIIANKQVNSCLLFSAFFEQPLGRDQTSFLSFWDHSIHLCASQLPITNSTSTWDGQLRGRLTTLDISAHGHFDLGPEMRQHIIAAAYGTESGSPHGDQETRGRKKSWCLKEHVSKCLASFYWTLTPRDSTHFQ